MLVFAGNELEEYISEEVESNWQRRDFLAQLELYANSKRRKVLAISGLRGTGKTVGLLQFLHKKEGVYITAQKNESVSALEYIELLRNIPQRIIVIDEYMWISNKNDEREELDGFLYTLVQNGKRVIITGTESIALEGLRIGELIHRMDILQVNNFPYNEFCRMNNLIKCKESCKEYLTTGGVFPAYVSKSFETMKKYFKEAIIDNLTSYVQNMEHSYAAAIVYTILHKAVCDSTEQSVPQIVEKRIPVEDFLDEIGVDSSVRISSRDFAEVSSILKEAGIIITVPNFRIESEYRTYITNPGLTYQMILATHELSSIQPELMNSILGYLFEASCVVHAHNNLIGDGYGQDRLYYLHKRKGGQESEIDFLICNTMSRHSGAYLFECKLNDGPVIKETSSVVSQNVELMLGDTEVLGRYVVYNGPRNYDLVNGKEVLYVGMDSLLAQYYSFSANKATILQEVRSQGRQTYLEERQGTEPGSQDVQKETIEEKLEEYPHE